MGSLIISTVNLTRSKVSKLKGVMLKSNLLKMFSQIYVNLIFRFTPRKYLYCLNQIEISSEIKPVHRYIECIKTMNYTADLYAIQRAANGYPDYSNAYVREWGATGKEYDGEYMRKIIGRREKEILNKHLIVTMSY
jgi:hypothetical protein